MGKSLTFKQSVKETLDLHMQKCSNPACETRAWKKEHQLDLALLKIEKLQKVIGCVSMIDMYITFQRYSVVLMLYMVDKSHSSLGRTLFSGIPLQRSASAEICIVYPLAGGVPIIQKTLDLAQPQPTKVREEINM